MKMTLLFLTLILGTLALHINLEKDEFWEDPDVEYFDLDESQFITETEAARLGDQNVTTKPPAITTTPTTSPTTTLMSTTANSVAPATTATLASTTTTTLPPTTTTTLPPTTTALPPTTIIGFLTTTKPPAKSSTTTSSFKGMSSNGLHSWDISGSQQVVLAEVFFKVYKELINANRKNGDTVFPPLSCQTVVTEQKICFICPPSFGILKMFDARCKWIPAANSDGLTSEDEYKILSEDIFADLLNMYAKFQTNSSPEQLVENVQGIDFSVIVQEENATGIIVPSNTVSLPPSSTLSIAGSYRFVPTDDPSVRKMVDFVVRELKTNNINLITSSYDFKSVITVQKQVVDDANYKMSLEFVSKENQHLYCTVQLSNNNVASESIPSLISHACI